MRENDKPMPLSELPGYMEHVRKYGQGDYVPVVDMGVIVDERPSLSWRLPMLFASALCLFLVAYAVNSTREITIVSGLDADRVSSIVADEGGRILSVKKDGEGRYKLRVFSLVFGSLMDGLRKNEELERVE